MMNDKTTSRHASFDGAAVCQAPADSDYLVYVIEDVNTPRRDEYQTQGAHALLRHLIDYHSWVDQKKLTEHAVNGIQLVCTMDPVSACI